MGILQEHQIIKPQHIHSFDYLSIQIPSRKHPKYEQITQIQCLTNTSRQMHHLGVLKEHHQIIARELKKNSTNDMKSSERSGKPPKWAVWNRQARGWLSAGSNWVLQFLQVLRIFLGLSMQLMAVFVAWRDLDVWIVPGRWKWRKGDLSKLVRVVVKDGIVGELILVPVANIIELKDKKETN